MGKNSARLIPKTKDVDAQLSIDLFNDQKSIDAYESSPDISSGIVLVNVMESKILSGVMTMLTDRYENAKDELASVDSQLHNGKDYSWYCTLDELFEASNIDRRKKPDALKSFVELSTRPQPTSFTWKEKGTEEAIRLTTIKPLWELIFVEKANNRTLSKTKQIWNGESKGGFFKAVESILKVGITLNPVLTLGIYAENYYIGFPADLVDQIASALPDRQRSTVNHFNYCIHLIDLISSRNAAKKTCQKFKNKNFKGYGIETDVYEIAKTARLQEIVNGRRLGKAIKSANGLLSVAKKINIISKFEIRQDGSVYYLLNEEYKGARLSLNRKNNKVSLTAQ